MTFQQTERTATGTARVLSNDDPSGGQRTSWDWDYSLVAVDSYASFPKSWFGCRWERFPAPAVRELFSPVLPDHDWESGFPVADHRWQVDRLTSQTVPITILCSWTLRLAQFRTFFFDLWRARGGS
jgi:uncharacterized protein (DUF608 family)